MKETILKQISRLNFDISSRHNHKESFSEQIYNEYANFDLDITFYFSDDLTRVTYITVDRLEGFDCGGETIDTSDITDNEIIEVLNY